MDDHKKIDWIVSDTSVTLVRSTEFFRGTPIFSRPRKHLITKLERRCEMASILLLGLDKDLAEPLALVLRRLSHDVTVTNSLAASLHDRRARIVFAAGDCPRYR